MDVTISYIATSVNYLFVKAFDGNRCFIDAMINITIIYTYVIVSFF